MGECERPLGEGWEGTEAHISWSGWQKYWWGEGLGKPSQDLKSVSKDERKDNGLQKRGLVQSGRLEKCVQVIGV